MQALSIAAQVFSVHPKELQSIQSLCSLKADLSKFVDSWSKRYFTTELRKDFLMLSSRVNLDLLIAS
jgi:hypothetical protein